MKLQYHPNVFFTALLQLFPPDSDQPRTWRSRMQGRPRRTLCIALQPMPASRIFADGWKGMIVSVFETLSHHKIVQFRRF